jgi:hypothetical protein
MSARDYARFFKDVPAKPNKVPITAKTPTAVAAVFASSPVVGNVAVVVFLAAACVNVVVAGVALATVAAVLTVAAGVVVLVSAFVSVVVAGLLGVVVVVCFSAAAFLAAAKPSA